MVTGICILAMTVVVLSYMESVALLHQKAFIGQMARRYILRMETVGYLTEREQTVFIQELDAMGVTEISLEGTTCRKVGYGAEIVLQVSGKLKGEFKFEEKRVSTAKN